MAALDFQFVQGSERLDWGVLVSIDIQRIIKDTNVDTLQRVVENIAFARLTRDEAAMFTPEHFIHLYTLCQLVIQYLVCSQECLAKINVRLNERVQELQQAVESLKQECDRLNQENGVLRKEVKAQRRTLLAYEYNRTGKNTTGGATYVCPQCGEMYGKCESLQSHIRKRHMKSSSAPSPTQLQPHPVTPEPPRQPESWRHDYDLKMQQMQDKLSSMERLVEKERERNDRLQREGMMMVVQAALGGKQTLCPTPPKVEDEKPDVQAQRPKPSEQQSFEDKKPDTTIPALSAAQVAGIAALPHVDSGHSLFAVPVVPDTAALQQYNITRQQEAANSALVKQVEELEKLVRSLKDARVQESARTTTLASKSGAAPLRAPSWLVVNNRVEEEANKVTTTTVAQTTPEVPQQVNPFSMVGEPSASQHVVVSRPHCVEQLNMPNSVGQASLPAALQQSTAPQPMTAPLAHWQTQPTEGQTASSHSLDPPPQMSTQPITAEISVSHQTQLGQAPEANATTVSPRLTPVAQQVVAQLPVQQPAPLQIQQQHPLDSPSQTSTRDAAIQEIITPQPSTAVPTDQRPQLVPPTLQPVVPVTQQQREASKEEKQEAVVPPVSVAASPFSPQKQAEKSTEELHNTSRLTTTIVVPTEAVLSAAAVCPSKQPMSNCTSSLASTGSLPQLVSTLKPLGQVQFSDKSSLDDSSLARPKLISSQGVDPRTGQHLVSSSKPSTAASSCTPEWLKNDSLSDNSGRGPADPRTTIVGTTNSTTIKESSAVPVPSLGPSSAGGIGVPAPLAPSGMGLRTHNGMTGSVPVPGRQPQFGTRAEAGPLGAPAPVPIVAASSLNMGSGVVPTYSVTGGTHVTTGGRSVNISGADLSSSYESSV